jgi:RNA polymerase sigma-70 factor, ECF subfamily
LAAPRSLLCGIRANQARRRASSKRGGKATQLDLDEIPAVGGGRAEELIELDEALSALAQIDPRKAQVIELRFFGGLSVEETAEVLKVSQETVLRDWRLARAWLLAQLSGKK